MSDYDSEVRREAEINKSQPTNDELSKAIEDVSSCPQRYPKSVAIVLSAARELQQLKADCKVMVDNLKRYADRTMWSKQVPDSYQGEINVFDWPGDLADEPYEFADKGLATPTAKQILEEMKK